MPKLPPKRLILKLGTQCNLGCVHCHQSQKSFKEHPGLLEWIRKEKFDRITFSGGEPLLYFDLIKRYMTALGHDQVYRIVTNGTLLTDEMADFFNGYDMRFAISYDGEESGRDDALPIQWDVVRKIKNFGFATALSNPDKHIREISEDIKKVLKAHDIHRSYPPEFIKVNFIHQTKDAPNILFTKAVADRYCDEVLVQLEKVIALFSMDPKRYKSLAVNLLGPWIKDRSYIEHGLMCCNPRMLNVNLDGTMNLCPYGGRVVGDIEHGIDWGLVDSLVPERCRKCEYWTRCACSCVANVTDHECHIHKRMVPAVLALAKKYGVAEELEDIL